MAGLPACGSMVERRPAFVGQRAQVRGEGSEFGACEIGCDKATVEGWVCPAN